MPSAAWLKAAKKTPMQPVIYAACESVDAINVTQKLASDWNSGTIDNLEVFALTGLSGASGVRPAVHESLLTATSSIEDWEVSTDKTAAFIVYSEGYLHSAKLRVVSPFIGDGEMKTIRVHIMDGTQIVSSSAVFSTYFFASLFPVGGWDTNGSGANVDIEFGVPILLQTSKQYKIAVELVTAPYSKFGWITAWTSEDSRIRRREIDASIITAAFDLGTAPNINSRILIDETVSGDATLTYTAEGSANNAAWTALGAVSDGKELPPYRYYRVTATFHGTPYHTPELYQVRIVGGNRQYTYIGTHRNEPAVPSGEVLPYLAEVSSLSSKIGLKEKSTVGDITLKLAWMPETADLVQATGKRRNIALYIGFVGLPLADYEPYFSGIWESYTADAEKRSFSIKLRDVWKKLKKEIPEQQIKGGVAVDSTAQFGKTLTGNGTTMNIIDAIVQVCDMAKAPDRYIDKAALSALKSAHYSGAEWNVYRLLTEKLDSDDLLNELSTMAGLFLVPAPNGQLTPKHYDTLAAATPTVVLDAAQIKFSDLAPDMAGTVTRHNIYYGLIAGESPGSAKSYTNVYSTIGSENTVIAERDREEIVVGEWFDNWGLAMPSSSGATNPITQLGDRLLTWYTPIATVSGKKVATTKTSVKAESVPLRYYGDVEPGNVVYVDNLRLPCPKAEWGGFSNKAKFLVLRRDVDSKKFTITLELFQLAEFAYNTTPSWSSYDQLGLYPSATSLTLAERNNIGVDGIISPSIVVSFDMPTGSRAGVYEVWYSADGAAPVLFTSVPAGQSTASLEIPATTGVSYTVNVVVANGSDRQPFYSAPTAALAVTGATGFATPANTGLQLTNGSVVSDLRDFVLTWDATTLPATLVSGYLVEILSLGNVVKRTAQVADNHYTYTYGMNLDDFGTPAASFKVRVSTVNANGATATPQTITVSNSAPSPPTALEATAQFLAIQLNVAYPEPDDFACLEVWAAVANDRSTSAKIAEIKGGVFTHTNIPDTSPRYYWVRVRDIYGNVSSYHPSSAAAGVSASTVNSPTILLNQLSGQITSSQLHAALSAKIDVASTDIFFTDPMAELRTGIEGDPLTSSPLPTGSAFSKVASTAVGGGAFALSIAGAAPEWNVTTRKAYPVLAGRTYRLKVMARRTVAGDGNSFFYAGPAYLDGSYQLISRPWSAATDINLTTGMGWQTYTVVFTPDDACKFVRPTILANYSSGVGTTEIAMMSLEDITESSLAAGSATSAATYASQASTAAGNAATASTQAQTYASTASGYAATASSAAATADEAANRYSAQYTLKVDANGNVAGIGLFSDNTAGSMVEILADRFAVTDGTATIVPFIVSGGNVYINSAYIQNLNANKILFTDTTNGHASLGKTAYSDDTHAGFWLGNDSGTPKFKVGSTTSYFGFDGTQSYFVGGFKTAAAGKRLELSSDGTLQFIEDGSTRMTIDSGTSDADGHIQITSPYVGMSIDSTLATFALKAYVRGSDCVAVYGGSTNNGLLNVGVWGDGTIGVMGLGDSKGVQGQGTSYDFYAYGPGANYGPFTGAHDALIAMAEEYEVGDIVVDMSIYHKQSVSSTLAVVAVSTGHCQKNVLGVVAKRDIPNHIPQSIQGNSQLMVVLNSHDSIIVNAVGEGQINVCREGGNIEAGDYICSSSTHGKGMKQPDDLMHNFTVAKAREACVWEDGEDDIKMIACIYHCG